MEFRKYQEGDLAQLVTDETLRAIVLTHPVESSLSWTLIDERVIGCGGFILMWPGVYEAWMYIDTPATFLKYKFGIIRKFRYELDQLPFHRVQATVDVATHNHGKFMGLLGFNPEATLQKYGYDGHDYIMYVRIRECLH